MSLTGEQVEALENRHVGDLAPNGGIYCEWDAQPWPCDARQALDALATVSGERDALKAKLREYGDALESVKAHMGREIDRLLAENAHLVEKRDAAEQREQRLREAIDSAWETTKATIAATEPTSVCYCCVSEEPHDWTPGICPDEAIDLAALSDGAGRGR